MRKKTFAYCYRVYNYDQYLYDVGELRALGYTIDTKWNDHIIKENPRFNQLYLHIHLVHKTVELYDHFVGACVVRNLEYIINELPVVK